MILDRRQFVALASGLLGNSLYAVATNAENNSRLYLSAASDAQDRHWVVGFSENELTVSEKFRHQLPARAHHIAVHKALGIYIVIARRPGNYLWVGDLATGSKLGEFTVPDDRHLYGHGVFTRDGSRFFTTENAWQMVNGDGGRIAVWSVTRDGRSVTMTRDLEFPSYGTGPHELLLKEDAKVLVVANGGIRTHPNRGREMLNLESMQPSLAYIAVGDGRLLEQHSLETEFHKASIRHLDMNAHGQVVMGMQFHGEPFERVPLLATHEQKQSLRPLYAPDFEQGQMAQYVGSVRYDLSGRYFAASCPRGNMITFWDAESGAMLDSLRSRDGCGVCAASNGFLFTAGTGRLSWYDLELNKLTSLDTDIPKVFWDNHLSIAAV